MKPELNLDVDSPEKVARVLENAGNAYADSGIELTAAWQDKSAGAPWHAIARILQRAARDVRKVVKSI